MGKLRRATCTRHTLSPTLRPTRLLSPYKPALTASGPTVQLSSSDAGLGVAGSPSPTARQGLLGSGLGPTDRVSYEERVGGVVVYPEVGVACTGGWPVGPHAGSPAAVHLLSSLQTIPSSLFLFLGSSIAYLVGR